MRKELIWAAAASALLTGCQDAPRLSADEAVDMALMEQCRGFVLSNSTYSWWAQYLAKATDKLVLAPEKWYAHTKKSALYLPDWQLIETD